MRVLIAPDCFTGTLNAVQAARAIADGWARAAPTDDLILRPMSDGGPGFVPVVAAGLGAELREVEVVGPLGLPVTATFALDGETAYLEAAQACGLQLVPLDRRDPGRTTTFGVGQMVLAAIEAGATKVVVGLGGSATNDGGAGLLSALGAEADRALDSGGRSLARLHSVDVEPARAAVAGVTIVAATDVDNPLLGWRGAARNYGAQKGATPAECMDLDAALEHFAGLVGRRPDGKDPAVAVGAGAAGGLGYALLQLGGERVPGIRTVMDILDLPREIGEADLVVTGEGRFDHQSLRGKVVSGIALISLHKSEPCVVIAGQVAVGRRDYTGIGVAAAYSVAAMLGAGDDAAGLATSMAQPAESLSSAAERVAATWSRRG
ncbi:MAG: glycerate kinase [Candidatus Nanopelagicales bacterium]